MASYIQVDEAVQILRAFSPGRGLMDVVEAIELHNAHRFFEAGFVPKSLSSDELAELAGASARERVAVARYFSGIDNSNAREVIRGVPSEYRSDLVELLGANRAYERCAADLMLSVLTAEGVHLVDILTNKKLVKSVVSTSVTVPERDAHAHRRHCSVELSPSIRFPLGALSQTT